VKLAGIGMTCLEMTQPTFIETGTDPECVGEFCPLSCQMVLC
jgi:hypothetical protein